MGTATTSILQRSKQTQPINSQEEEKKDGAENQ